MFDFQKKNICFYMSDINQPTLQNRMLSSCLLFPLHKAARLKINEEFRKNKNETSEENISKVQWKCLSYWVMSQGNSAVYQDLNIP